MKYVPQGRVERDLNPTLPNSKVHYTLYAAPSFSDGPTLLWVLKRKIESKNINCFSLKYQIYT